MRKQFKFEKSGTEIKTLGFEGKVKQIFVNGYSSGEGSYGRIVTKLSDTKLDMEISGMEILEDYHGSPVDEFNILTEEFDVGEKSSLEVDINGQTDEKGNLNVPVIVTMIYELPEHRKRTNLR